VLSKEQHDTRWAEFSENGDVHRRIATRSIVGSAP